MSGSGIHSHGFIAWLSTIYRSTTVPGSRRVLESPLLVGDKHSVGAAERLGAWLHIPGSMTRTAPSFSTGHTNALAS
jgi:hypothetical protein